MEEVTDQLETLILMALDANQDGASVRTYTDGDRRFADALDVACYLDSMRKKAA